MPKLVYLSMPYRAATPDGILKNIMKAREVAKWLWKQGYYVICPHTNTFMMDGVVEDSVFLEGDIEILKRCDAIVMGPGYIHSRGAMSEYKYAFWKGITIRILQGTGPESWKLSKNALIPTEDPI